MIQRLAALGLIGCACLLAGFGPYGPNSLSPASRAMAGVGVASGAGTTALYTNPAGLGAIRQHTIELGYGRDGLGDRSTFFIQSADGQAPGFFQAGSMYAYETGPAPTNLGLEDGTRAGHDFRFGVAAGTQGQIARVLVGASARRLDLEYRDAKDKVVRNVSGWTGDAGLAVALTGNVRLGAVWRNFLTVDGQETPMRVAGGAALVFSSFMLAVDGSWGLGKGDGGGIYRVGTAVSVIDALQIRAGYRFDGFNGVDNARQQITGGFGWRINRFSLDASVEVDLERPSDVGLSVAINYYLPTLR